LYVGGSQIFWLTAPFADSGSPHIFLQVPGWRQSSTYFKYKMLTAARMRQVMKWNASMSKWSDQLYKYRHVNGRSLQANGL
jgi:hypothetical protein